MSASHLTEGSPYLCDWFLKNNELIIILSSHRLKYFISKTFFLYDFVYRKHYFSVKEDETMLLSFDQYSHNVGSVEHLEEPGEANSSSAIIISLTICIDDLTQRLYICSSRLRSLDKLFYFEGKWQVQCTSG